jgi:hypothetical protein
VRIRSDPCFGPRYAKRLAAYACLTCYIFLDGQTGVDSERHQEKDQARDVDAFVTLRVILHIVVDLARTLSSNSFAFQNTILINRMNLIWDKKI